MGLRLLLSGLLAALLVSSFSTAFVSLSLLISAADLAGLKTAASSIADRIAALDAPSAAELDYALSKYGDEKGRIYLPQLKAAWSSAIKAKERAGQMLQATFSSGFSFDSAKKLLKLSLGIGLQSYEAEAKSYFDAAIKGSYETLLGLADLVDSDVAELDELGADNQNYTETPHSRYLEAANLVLVIERARLGTGAAAPSACGNGSLAERTVCVVEQQPNAAKDPDLAAALFNTVIGYPNRSSLLAGYLEFHGRLQAAGAEMRASYEGERSRFGQLSSDVEALISALRAEDVELIDASALEAFGGAAIVSIVAKPAGTPAAQFRGIDSRYQQLRPEKALAERIFEEKADDYLFRAISTLEKTNSQLAELGAWAASLSSDVDEVLADARQAYEKAKSQVPSFQLNVADTGRKGKRIADYARAIRLLNQLAACTNCSDDYERAGQVLDQLEKAGLDVSQEKWQYEKLKDGSAETTVQRQTALAGLERKLDSLAGPVVDDVLALREQAGDYVATAELLSQDPALSLQIDGKKVAQQRQAYDLSLTKELIPNVAELSGTYSSIIDYLEPLVERLAPQYLQSSVSTEVYPDGPLACGQFVAAKVLVILRNPTTVPLGNFVFPKKLGLAFDTDSPDVINDTLSIRIAGILPGESRAIGLSGRALALECSQPRDYQDGDARAYERYLTPRATIGNATVLEQLPGTVISFSTEPFVEASIAGNVIYLQGIAQKTRLTAHYRQLTIGVNASPTTIPSIYNATLAFEERKNTSAYDGAIARLCLFGECADLQRLQQLGDSSLGKKIDEKMKKLLASFDAAAASLEGTAALLEEFGKAADTKVDVVYDVRYVVYNERDYSKWKNKLGELQEIATLLPPQGNTTVRFQELSEKFSAVDLKKFANEAGELAVALNDSIVFLKEQATAEIAAARERYDGNETSHTHLQKSLDSFRKGYYNRASIYAREVRPVTPSGASGSAAASLADFPYGIFAAFVIIAAFAGYSLRKPRQPQIKRLLRLPEED